MAKGQFSQWHCFIQIMWWLTFKKDPFREVDDWVSDHTWTVTGILPRLPLYFIPHPWAINPNYQLDFEWSNLKVKYNEKAALRLYIQPVNFYVQLYIQSYRPWFMISHVCMLWVKCLRIEICHMKAIVKDAWISVAYYCNIFGEIKSSICTAVLKVFLYPLQSLVYYGLMQNFVCHVRKLVNTI